VRYGPPDEMLRTISRRPEDTDPNNFKYVPPNLTWLYRGAERANKLIFEFVQISSYVNEWRLGSPILETNLLKDRVVLDPRYDELFRAWESGDKIKIAFVSEKVLQESRVSTATVLTTERHIAAEKVEPMELATSLTSFRTDDDKTLVDITYGISLDDLTKGMRDSVNTTRLEVALQIHDSKGNVAWNSVDTNKVRPSREKEGTYVDFYRMSFPPDSYSVALQVRPLVSNSMGSWRTKVRIRDYSRPGLQMSDIQFLLPTERRGTMEVEGIKVMPSPFERYRSNQILRTYIQVYNLSMDVTRKTYCSIEYEFKRIGQESGKGVIASVISVFKSKKKSILTVNFERQESESMLTQYMPFPMEQFEPGEYIFKVRVTDKRLNRTVERTRNIEIQEEVK
jgi:hypothetical protein